jgi:hypothetical protein
MSRERGCCRFSGFTTTAYPLRVEQCLPQEGATGRNCSRAPTCGLADLCCLFEEAP